MVESNKFPGIECMVKRISENDEKAFEQLYRAFSKKIYYTSKKMNLSHEDAEEIVQEVFLIIWKNRKNLDSSLSINAYMIAIVRSLIVRKVKREARLIAFQKYGISRKFEVSNNTEEEVDYADLYELTKEMINQLPKGQKQIFLMKNTDGQSIDQIAEKLQLSRRTVENQIFRATKNVKNKMIQMKIITWNVFLILPNL
ncbi:MAG: sigma-70 family RNA polymerase sigma factor [Cyclobacteriaceae bacterium]